MPEEQVAKGGSNKKIIIIAIIAFLLFNLIVIGIIMLVVMGGSDEVDNFSEQQKTAVSNHYNYKVAAKFYKVRPTFIVNFHTDGRRRYFKTDVEILVRSNVNLKLVKNHAPLVRHVLTDIFTAVREDDLLTEEGRLSLAKRCSDTLNVVLKTETGMEPVEKILFTRFIVN